MQGYKPSDLKVWQGRIDSQNDPQAFRWHQLIDPLNLNSRKNIPLGKKETGICFLGFCCDKGIKENQGRPGAGRAPDFIRREMANLPSFFKSNISLYDAGDLYNPQNTLTLKDLQKNLARCIRKILALKMLPVVLGGGHEIALGHYQGIIDSRQGKKKIGIVNFDAHFDLRPYRNGANSGTMFRQIADDCKKSGRDFKYFCVGIQKYANTISLFKKARELKVPFILARDIDISNMQKIYHSLDQFLEEVDGIYITLCADVFSSAVAPGVSASQPFGLDPEIVLILLKYLINSHKVISFDIAEISPRFDEDNRTAKLAAITIFAFINTFTGSDIQIDMDKILDNPL